MLNQLSINDVSNYKIFYEYVINYWDLTDKQIIMKNNNFYERWLNKSINKNIEQSTNKNIEQSINKNSNLVIQHLNKLDEMGVLKYNIIAFNVIYAHYKDWFVLSNSDLKPMKQIEYTKRMKNLLINYGYIENAKRTIRNINKQDFNLDLFNNIYYDETKKSSVVMRPKIDIEKHLDEFNFDLQIKQIDEIKQKYSDSFISQYIKYLFNNCQYQLNNIFSDNTINDIYKLDIDTIIEKLINYYQNNDNDDNDNNDNDNNDNDNNDNDNDDNDNDNNNDNNNDNDNVHVNVNNDDKINKINKMKNTITLYEFLENEAIIDNITNVELAKRLDISYPTFANIKKRKPSRHTYHKFANYFNIEVYDLLKFPIKK